MAKAWDIVGYGYNGDMYCPDCVPDAKETGCTCGKTDANGACASNCSGSGPNPQFASDEGSEHGDVCTSCGNTITEPWGDGASSNEDDGWEAPDEETAPKEHPGQGRLWSEGLSTERPARMIDQVLAGRTPDDVLDEALGED
ncbi:MAG: hypothetical protein IPH13_20025 [Planctomycetes bacterium]|nr:hypothetical protein [Planctomycetota bacterium]